MTLSSRKKTNPGKNGYRRITRKQKWVLKMNSWKSNQKSITPNLDPKSKKKTLRSRRWLGKIKNKQKITRVITKKISEKNHPQKSLTLNKKMAAPFKKKMRLNQTPTLKIYMKTLTSKSNAKPISLNSVFIII